MPVKYFLIRFYPKQGYILIKRVDLLAYIHIPYCDSKCHYCAFNSYVGKFDTRSRYMEALYRQTEHDLERFEVAKESLETLFVGGGTPSTIMPELYMPLFELLEPYLRTDAEITAEANPNSASTEWLEGMHKLGVNRISFGVQSFDRDKLKFLGRSHDPEQARQAVMAAKQVGLEHISLDLIYNAYGDTQALIARDIEQAFSLPIDHISAYELTIESNTPFSTTPEVRQDDESLAFFVAEQITKHQFEHYEISNFGSYQSRHNLGYWKQKNYMGLGAGAVGFMDDTRYYPHTDIDSYIDDPVTAREEHLTQDELLTEMIFLGLRSKVGIAEEKLPLQMRKRLQLLVSEGKLSQENGKLINPNFFLSDEIALFLLGE